LAEQNPAKYHLANNTGIIKTFGFVIPQNANEYTSFYKKMENSEKELIDTL
jgi:hypothetical protein